MPNDRCDPRGRDAEIDQVRIQLVMFCHDAGKNNRSDTFGEVDKKNWISESLAEHPGYVCSSDVAAAERSNVDSSEPAGDVPCRKRSKQISNCGNGQDRKHKQLVLGGSS